MLATLNGVLAYLDLREVVRLTDGTENTPGEALDLVFSSAEARIADALRRGSMTEDDFAPGYLENLASRLSLGGLWARKANVKIPDLLRQVYLRAETELDHISRGNMSLASVHVISNDARGWPIKDAR